MSNDVRLDKNYRSHPKVIELYDCLQADGVLALVDLWAWCGIHATNGYLGPMSPEMLERCAKFPGGRKNKACDKKGTTGWVFYDAMLRIGFIDMDDMGRLSIHNWAKHQKFVNGTKMREMIAEENSLLAYGKKAGILKEEATREEAIEIVNGYKFRAEGQRKTWAERRR